MVDAYLHIMVYSGATINQSNMNLVQIKGKEPITSTLIVAEGMELKHRAIMVLVDKYKEKLETFGTFAFEMRKSGGRPVRFAWLNEGQTVFLISLMRNSKIVVNFKQELTKEFFRQRKLIAHLLTQRQNKAWLEQREQGKLSRREETDTIKEFVDYCKARGSLSAERYYANISKMENKALFILEQKFPNIRDILSGQQLQIIASADVAVARALRYGMEQNMPYKEIYQLAKKRIMEFADIVGRTPIPLKALQISPVKKKRVRLPKFSKSWRSEKEKSSVCFC